METALAQALAIAAPLLLVAMGGLYSEASGVLNIALEGLMIAGAFAAAVMAGVSPLATGAAALCAAALVACALGFVSFRLGADPFVAALAINLAAQAVVSVAAEHLFGTKGVVPVAGLGSSPVDFGALSHIPLLGPALFGQRPSFYAIVAMAALLAYAFRHTVFGLRVRAAGSRPEALVASGVDVARIRIAAFAVSGMAAGVAGAALASDVGAWVPNIAGGRGWIALVAVYLGRKTVVGTLVSSLGLGAAFALGNAAQAFAVVPGEVAFALPYAVAAVVALTGSGARHRERNLQRGT